MLSDQRRRPDQSLVDWIQLSCKPGAAECRHYSNKWLDQWSKLADTSQLLGGLRQKDRNQSLAAFFELFIIGVFLEQEFVSREGASVGSNPDLIAEDTDGSCFAVEATLVAQSQHWDMPTHLLEDLRNFPLPETAPKISLFVTEATPGARQYARARLYASITRALDGIGAENIADNDESASEFHWKDARSGWIVSGRWQGCSHIHNGIYGGHSGGVVSSNRILALEERTKDKLTQHKGWPYALLLAYASVDVWGGELEDAMLEFLLGSQRVQFDLASGETKESARTGGFWQRGRTRPEAFVIAGNFSPLNYLDAPVELWRHPLSSLTFDCWKLQRCTWSAAGAFQRSGRSRTLRELLSPTSA